MRLIPITTLLLLLLTVACGVHAQDTLRGNYGTLHLRGGVYLATETVSIADSLVVDAGTKIYFSPGVSMLAQGVVRMNGTPGSTIQLLSRTTESGQGLVVIGNYVGEVSIRYTQFSKLLLPLDFEVGWYRTRVTISNNEFVNNEGPIAVLQLLSGGDTKRPTDPEIAVTIRENLFAENRSPVYIQDFMTDHMQIRMEQNAFVNNRIQEYGKYTYSSNMLFGRMDKLYRVNAPVITGNSFVNNYLWDNATDSLVHHANMGVYGNLDSLVAPGNYWGGKDERTRRRGIYDYMTNYTTPKIVTSDYALQPSPQAPPHVYATTRLPARERQRMERKIRDGVWRLVVDSVGTDIDDRFDLSTGMQSLRLSLNRAADISQMEVHYRYMGDSLDIKDTLLVCKTDEDKEGEFTIEFSYRQDSLLRRHNGYLRINGITGQQGEYVPSVNIGYIHFLGLYREEKQLALLRKLSMAKDSTRSSAKTPDPKIAEQKYGKPFEIGLMGCYALYYGTLSNRSLFKNDFNAGIGVEFRYALKNHIAVTASLMRLKLSGSDLRSDDPLKIARGMSFVTPMTAASVQIEYSLNDSRYYTERRKLNAAIGFGFDYISFNPKGEYLGQLYDLQPIGTGGQYLQGAANPPYSLSSFGAPISAKLRYTLNKRTVYTVFASYHMTFTNYLDDVGPDLYADPVALAAANPSSPEAAVYFANPTKRPVTKGQLRSGSTGGSDGFFMMGFVLSYHF